MSTQPRDTRPHARPDRTPDGRTVPQWLALVVGAAFTLVGLAGFLVTGVDGWTAHDPDQTLVGFAVNPLHNVVHLLLGVAGLVLSRRDRTARGFGWLLVVGYGAALVYGVVVVRTGEGDVLNINGADNVLHAGAVVVGLVTALWPRGRHGDEDLGRA